MCAVVLFVMSFGLGNASLFLLRREGAELWLAFAGFFVVFASVYVVIAPMILRLRLKERAGAVHLTGHGA
jgi:hypothetical protein